MIQKSPSVLSAIKKLRELLTRHEKMQWVGIAGFALCTSLLEVLTATVIVIFAQVLNQPETGQKYLSKIGFPVDLSAGRTVFYIAMIVGAIYFIKNIFAAFEVFFQNFVIQKMNYHFKNKLLHRYAEADYAYYLTRNSSLGLQVVSGDAEQVFSLGMISIATILSESVIFFVLIGMIIFMNPILALMIFAIGFVLSVIITKAILPLFYKFGQRLQESSLCSYQNLMQFFHGFKEIILLGKQNFFIDAYKCHAKKKARVQALQTATNAIPRMVIEVLFVGIFVVTVAFLCFENDTPSQMMGILGGYLYAGFRLMPGLNRILIQLNSFKSAIPNIERVHQEYMTVATKGKYIDCPSLIFTESINITSVSFRYIKANRDALKDVTLTIHKGESIGIVGETGSGKSTLIDVILGLLLPYKGSALIDGKFPVNSIQWHQKIGYVPQAIYLTDDTIEKNIAFGKESIDEERLNLAIDAAQLRKFIAQLSEGVKTVVGERGVRLSGGERQRIAIARALYHNPDVLIFDEATSALDNETEERLMETIKSVSKNRTVIMIAHRLTTLKDCDRVITIENGKIKE